MKQIKLLARKPYFLIISCAYIFIFSSAFKLGVFQTSSSKAQVDFPVISLVPSLSIIDVKVKGYSVILLLRNDSDKTITALSLSSSGVNYRSDMVGTEDIIRPGAFHIEQCGVPSLTRPEKGITLLAVVYEDGSSEGEPRIVKQIMDVRAGTQTQLGRILPLFRDIASTPKSMRIMQKREAVKLKLEQLPEEESGKSVEYRLGLHDTKELAIDKIKQIEQIEQEKGEDVVRKVLPQIIDKYENKNLLISNSLKYVR